MDSNKTTTDKDEAELEPKVEIKEISANEPLVQFDAQDDTIIIQRTAQVRLREAWVGWTQVVANVLVPLTLIIAALSLLQQNIDTQRDASVNQITLFYSENLSQAQITLFDLWSGTDLTVLRLPQTRNFIDAFVERQIASSEIDDKHIRAAIVTLTSYFDRVEQCISSGTCDDDSILAQVGDFGLNFYCIYSGEIDKVRESILVPKLGLGLKNFAIRMGGCKGGPLPVN